MQNSTSPAFLFMLLSDQYDTSMAKSSTLNAVILARAAAALDDVLCKMWQVQPITYTCGIYFIYHSGCHFNFSCPYLGFKCCRRVNDWCCVEKTFSTFQIFHLFNMAFWDNMPFNIFSTLMTTRSFHTADTTPVVVVRWPLRDKRPFFTPFSLELCEVHCCSRQCTRGAQLFHLRTVLFFKSESQSRCTPHFIFSMQVAFQFCNLNL